MAANLADCADAVRCVARPFAMVVAATRLRGIGLAGKMPWPNLSGDMRTFKRITSQLPVRAAPSPLSEAKAIPAAPLLMNAMIMGRTTYHSIPLKHRELPGRHIIVLTRDKTKRLEAAGAIHCAASLLEAFQIAETLTQGVADIFVVGGAQVYAEAMALPQCQTIFYTQVLREYPCDVFFPALDSRHFQLESVGEVVVETNGVPYQYLTYKRRSHDMLAPRETLAAASAASSTPALPCESSASRAPETRASAREHKEVKREPSAAEATAPAGAQEHKEVKRECVDNLEERQYLDLVRRAIDHGKHKIDRTGVGTRALFGCVARYSLRDDVFPLLTTKRVFWRGVVEELLWMIKGGTDAKDLQAKGVKIWDGNGTKAFLESVGQGDREEFDLGPIYGHQWRFFGAPYTNCHADYKGQGFDQLASVISQIRKTPDSRRILMSAWNPKDLARMALPPCHVMCQFFVADGELSCTMYQRSVDLGLGAPFNIASYALLTRMIAHICGLRAGDFVHMMGDTHVYSSHVTPLKMQLERAPRAFPKLRILETRTDIETFTFEDFELVDYRPHGAIKMDMAL